MLLDDYEHPIFGLDLVQLEKDLKLLYEGKWSDEKNLLENILAVNMPQGKHLVKELQHKMKAHYAVLKVMIQALEESKLLPDIPSP